MSLEDAARFIPVLEIQDTQVGMLFKIYNDRDGTDAERSDPVPTDDLATQQPLLG